MGVALDGLGAAHVITVAPGAVMTIRPCPVVVSAVSDINKAASTAFVMPMAKAPISIPVADDRAPGIAVTVGAVTAPVGDRRLQFFCS